MQVTTILPHKLKSIAFESLLLMRLHRPVGILLLLWPTLAALWFASKGEPDWRLIVIFTLGCIVMRSAGCVINDIADRHFDGQVKRTCLRPLATQSMSVKEAVVLFFLLLCLAFVLVSLTNGLTIILSLGGVFLASFYPLTKRYTHFPQVVLGAAYGWAIPMAYAAQIEHFPLDCWILYAATLIWSVAYDTLYAMVDRDDDLKIGIKSTAIFFGCYDKLAVGISHVLVLALWCCLGRYLQCGVVFYGGIVVAFGFALYQQWLIRYRCPQACFQAFLNNQWFGLVLFVGAALNVVSV